MSTNRRTYDAEFKKNAVALAAEDGKTVSEVAVGLGVVAANLVSAGGVNSLRRVD